MRGTVPRESCLNQLWDWKDRTDAVKMVVGARGCGKSTLLAQFKERLLEAGHEGQVIHIDMDSKGSDHIKDQHDLIRHLEPMMDGGGRRYILLDEVQRVEGWELAVSSLREGHDVDLYLAGSNASLLSPCMDVHASGGFVRIDLLPLSFSEHLLLHPPGEGSTVDDRFSEYLSKGAMPMARPDDEGRTDLLLEGMLSTILCREVASLLGIVDLRTLDEVTAFVMSNVGSVTSPAAIAKEASLSHPTVKRYLQGLEDAFLIHRALRWDVRGKRLLKTTGKYYAADTGMRNVILRGDSDIGRLLENVVYLELRRRGFSVTSGSFYDREIDLVAKKRDVVEYYQVALSMLDDGTFERETRSLASVPDNHPKTILTLDRVLRSPPDGIRALNVIDWIQG